MSVYKLVVGICVVFLSFWGCKTDVKLQADWKEIMVVYSLLESNKTEHFIKITKAFIDPNGNALEVAKIKDSLYFADLAVKIDEVVNGQVKETMTFEAFEDSNKEPGIFASPNQVLYKATGVINEDAIYKLTITNNKTGNIVTSETNIVKEDGLILTAPKGNLVAIPPNDIAPLKVSWFSTENGKVYQANMYFRYDELDDNVINTDTVVMKVVNNLKTKTTFGHESHLEKFLGSKIFDHLGFVIPLPTSSSISRRWVGVDVEIIVGGLELSNYIDVNNAQISLVGTQAKPTYTNIKNGLGLFSSRLTKMFPDKKWTDLTVDQLACHDATIHLQFRKVNGTTICP
jgi:hypothetical protein